MSKKPCLAALCPKYAEPGKSRCLEHHREWERERKRQGATGRRGTTAAWSKARLESLRLHHWRCVRCNVHISELKQRGEQMHVHHINGDPKDHTQSNLEPRCPQCHKLVS